MNEGGVQNRAQQKKKGEPTLQSGSFRLNNDQSDLFFFIGTNDTLEEGLKLLGHSLRTKRKNDHKNGCVHPIPPNLPAIICIQPCSRLKGLEEEFQLYFQGLVLSKNSTDVGEKVTRNYPHQPISGISNISNPKTFLFLDTPTALEVKRVSLFKDFRTFNVDGLGSVTEVFLNTQEELEALLPNRPDVKDASSNTELLQPEEMEIEMSKDPLQEENSLFNEATHAETDCQGIDSNSIPSNASSALARIEADYKMKLEILTRKNKEEKEKHEKDMQNLNNTMKNLLDGFNALQEKVSGLETENKSLKDEFTTMRSENKSLQEELSTMRIENKSLRDELSPVKSENKLLRDELSTLKTENNALNIELSSMKMGNSLRIELCTFKTQNKSLKDNLSLLKTQKIVSIEKREVEEERNLSTLLLENSRLEEMINEGEEQVEERLEDYLGIVTFQGVEKEERRLLNTLPETNKVLGPISESDNFEELKSKKVKKNSHNSLRQAQSESQSQSLSSLSLTKSLFGDSFAPLVSTFSPDRDVRLPQKMEIDPPEVQQELNEEEVKIADDCHEDDVNEIKTLEEDGEEEAGAQEQQQPALSSSEPDFSFINHFQKEERVNTLQDLPSLKKDWDYQFLAFQNGQDLGSLIVDAYLRIRYGELVKKDKKNKKTAHWHLFESNIWTQIDSGKITPTALDYEVLSNKELLIFPMHISMEDYDKNQSLPIIYNPLKTRSHWVVIVIQNKTPDRKWWGPSFAVDAFYFDTFRTNSFKPPPFSFVPQILGYIGDCILRMFENKQNPEIPPFKNPVTGRPSLIDCAHNAYRVRLHEQETIYSSGLHALWNIDEVITNSCKHLCKTNEAKVLPQNNVFDFEKKMREQVRKFVSIYLQIKCPDLPQKFVENHTRTPDFRRKITHTAQSKVEAAANMREESSVKHLVNHHKRNLRAKKRKF